MKLVLLYRNILGLIADYYQDVKILYLCKSIHRRILDSISILKYITKEIRLEQYKNLRYLGVTIKVYEKLKDKPYILPLEHLVVYGVAPCITPKTITLYKQYSNVTILQLYCVMVSRYDIIDTKKIKIGELIQVTKHGDFRYHNIITNESKYMKVIYLGSWYVDNVELSKTKDIDFLELYQMKDKVTCITLPENIYGLTLECTKLPKITNIPANLRILYIFYRCNGKEYDIKDLGTLNTLSVPILLHIEEGYERNKYKWFPSSTYFNRYINSL